MHDHLINRGDGSSFSRVCFFVAYCVCPFQCLVIVLPAIVDRISMHPRRSLTSPQSTPNHRSLRLSPPSLYLCVLSVYICVLPNDLGVSLRCLSALSLCTSPVSRLCLSLSSLLFLSLSSLCLPLSISPAASVCALSSGTQAPQHGDYSAP